MFHARDKFIRSGSLAPETAENSPISYIPWNARHISHMIVGDISRHDQQPIWIYVVLVFFISMHILLYLILTNQYSIHPVRNSDTLHHFTDIDQLHVTYNL